MLNSDGQFIQRKHQEICNRRIIRLFLLYTAIFSVLPGCRTSKTIIVSPDETKEVSLREYSAQAVLWQQISAEYKALCFQAYNLAKLRLDDMLENTSSINKPLAIITDLDETVLDNSPFNARLIHQDENYSSERWIEWGKLEIAEAVPGALDFFNYAAHKGVEIFYISNRYAGQQEETLSNLEKLGFPYSDEGHILLRTSTSGKEDRRQSVYDTYRVLFLLGDNLSDFTESFEGEGTERRNEVADSLQSHFGRELIVLPNPMYGDWENHGLYEGKYHWTAEQRDSIRKEKLRIY